ncbi:hypothetical protein RJ640_029487 [Escallonia rubra]|uniref:Peptidase metallopeptidase domain-containing protein n=1 Tax=Escallonia rubra TaxID=112253 RepID=A0AA88RRU9_9ASTE|nr:hypothetical protein RJ640_029487 [Escallonia rubra]
MNSHLVFALLSVLLLAPSISALPHFFPNVSSIPPSLVPNISAGAWQRFEKFRGCRAGENKDGLSRLKQYFNHFGYMKGITGANFTDDFDDALEAALKTYQTNFNLNATGELDEPTLKQLVRPRCGVADVVNGSSTMNSGKAASVHLHTVSHYTFFPGTPRWSSSKSDLTYAFVPENQLSDEVKTVFSHAFERWSEVTTLTFTETSSFISADIKIGFYTGDHGDGEAFDGVLGTLAHAFSPPSGQLHLDGDENWVINGGIIAPTVPSAVDLESVAVHEIGHLLGLGHSSIEDAIMFPTITSGSRKVELTSDDVQGVQSLYGSNPNYNGTTSVTVQERDTNGAYFVGPLLWGRGLALALGLVLLVL